MTFRQPAAFPLRSWPKYAFPEGSFPLLIAASTRSHIPEGRLAKITIYSSANSTAFHELAEMGQWRIYGVSREPTPFHKHVDVFEKFEMAKPLEPGFLQFSGWFDASDTTGQNKLLEYLNDGTFIGSSSSGTPNRLRLWTCDDTSFDGYGYFQVPAGRDCGLTIIDCDVGSNKQGLCEISFTGKISGNAMAFSTG